MQHEQQDSGVESDVLQDVKLEVAGGPSYLDEGCSRRNRSWCDERVVDDLCDLLFELKRHADGSYARTKPRADGMVGSR